MRFPETVETMERNQLILNLWKPKDAEKRRRKHYETKETNQTENKRTKETMEFHSDVTQGRFAKLQETKQT